MPSPTSSTRWTSRLHAATYLSLFDQIWNDPEKLEDVTAQICDHIASVYQENSPESIYFLMLYNIFNEFLGEIDEDVLPNDRTGYQDTLIWKKLFNYQRDAATGIINKLETYSGCILADSVGLGKTFTALAVVKYYELRNKSVLVLCPKKLADNWLNYNRNLKTNIFAKDRFNYDVLCHTDLSRTSGESFGIPLNRVNWGNYDLVVIDESHNFRNNDAYKDKETRYQKLMNKVIKEGVKTKVLMLSATPVNNRFNDLRNQLALAYEGDSENLSKKLRTEQDGRRDLPPRAGSVQRWSKLPPEERTPRHPGRAGLRLLRAAGQRDHRPLAQAHPDLLRHQGHRPVPRAPQALVVPLPADAAHGRDGFNEIFEQPALAAEAGRVRARQLHPAQPAQEVRRDVRHRGGWRRRQAQARPTAKEPAGADDHQPAQAAGKLGASPSG
jgi:SNF2 family DNA or RNA helicase